jgi:phage terminase large subunit GpA-like protein
MFPMMYIQRGMAMSFLDKLRQIFGGGGSGSGASASDSTGLWFHFRCRRCGETVRIRVDRRNDLNREDDGPGALVLRKEVMDDSCFQLIHAEIWLDNSYNVVSSDVSGGELITEEAYQAATKDKDPV